MYAYMIVDPTNPNPRCLRSLLNASDSGDVAGIPGVFQSLTFGRPPTNRQQYASKLPNSPCTSRKARALRTVAWIFARLRTIAGSVMSFSTRVAVYRATFAGSNSLKARRYPSRFLRIVD